MYAEEEVADDGEMCDLSQMESKAAKSSTPARPRNSLVDVVHSGAKKWACTTSYSHHHRHHQQQQQPQPQQQQWQKPTTTAAPIQTAGVTQYIITRTAPANSGTTKGVYNHNSNRSHSHSPRWWN